MPNGSSAGACSPARPGTLSPPSATPPLKALNRGNGRVRQVSDLSTQKGELLLEATLSRDFSPTELKDHRITFSLRA